MNRGKSMTEAQHQKTLMDWAAIMTGKYPELALLHHIPNGGSRNAIEARHLKEQGVKPGVPDLCLPVARGQYHGLYIELKKPGGRPSKAQKQWLAQLTSNGYRAALCYGWEDAAGEITRYLEAAEW